MGPEKRIKLAICLVLFFLCTGTVGYSLLDGYSLIDAFYMTVITISTVGYGEIQPLSEVGKIFTIFLILSGIGSLAFAAGTFTEMVIERSANPDRWKKAMDKRISKLKGHVIICGHGRVGRAAADYFKTNSAPFVVIENSSEGVKELQELGYYFIQGDGTRENVLLRAGIKKASSLLAVLNSDPDNLFAVLTARELNPVLRIIARTEHSSSESRMKRAGADSVISPFVAAGQRVAESLLAKAGQVGGDLETHATGPQHSMWLSVQKDSDWLGKSFRVVGEEIGGRIVGLRRNNVDALFPPGDDSIGVGDQVLITHDMIERSPEDLGVDSKKIVFIDDNPVILRLYTRLFQKAGFNIRCASTGLAGYQLIENETPDAAVIDYHLPDMSGLDICEKIQTLEAATEMKIFLFTADEQEDVKKMAMETGVDKVVVKSPDAGEIVSMVSSYLS